MRIGLIGLGRIGAFHAETLSALPSVTSLVVTDAVAGGHPAGRRRYGVEAAATPARSCWPRASTAWWWPRPPTPTRSSSSPRSRPGCRCSARSRWRKTMAEAVAVARRVAGPRRAHPDRLPAPLRPGLRRRPAGDRERRTRVGAHRALHDPRPGPAARGLPRRVRRHLPRLQHPRLRRGALGHRPGGRRGLRDRVRPGRPRLRRHRRRGLRRDRAHPRRRRPRGGVQQPLQRPRPRRAAWRCTARWTASRPVSTKDCRCARRSRA